MRGDADHSHTGERMQRHSKEAEKQKAIQALSDRFNVKKSKEMFILIQAHHNPENNVEKAIRSWNGGPKYSVRGTQKYLNKVMKILKKSNNRTKAAPCHM